MEHTGMGLSQEQADQYLGWRMENTKACEPKGFTAGWRLRTEHEEVTAAWQQATARSLCRESGQINLNPRAGAE